MARRFDVSYLSPMDQLKAGISRVESGGNYLAQGPEIQRKAGTDRAYGKYQVMGANIPSWTEAALGRKLSPFEFLHSPEAQEAVFEHQMGKNLQQYGNLQDAASVWFSGRPLAEAQKAGAHDVNMGVGSYVAKALGGGPSTPGMQVAGGDEELFRRLQARAASRLSGGVTTASEQPAESPEAMDAFARLRERAAQRIAPTPLPTAAPVAPAVAPPSPPLPPVPAPAQLPTDVWGPGQEYLNALTFGASRAALPYSSEQVAQMRKAYETEHPYQSAAMEIGGGITQGLGLAFAPEIAGAVGVGTALRAIPGVSRALPFVERLAAMRPGYAGPFPSGGYVAQPGAVEAGKRVAAGIGAGAAKGAGQAALNVGVHPEVPAGEQIALGGTVGAMAEPVARYVSGAAGPAMAPRIEEPLRDIGKMANTKYGISLMPWQLSNMPEEEALASKLLTREKALLQTKQFGEAFGKLFGHSGNFTPANVQTSARRVGDEMETIANNTRIDLTHFGGRQLRRDIDDVVHEILTDVADPTDQAKLLKTIQLVDNKLFQHPLRGEIIQNLTQKDGTIDKNISPKMNSLYQYYNGRIKDIIYDTFHRTDASNAAAWDAAKQKYKAALIALKGSSDSGLLDPTKVAKQAAKVRGSGAIAELAQIGNQMHPVSPKGAPIIPTPQSTTDFWQRPSVQILGAAAAPFAAGNMTELGANILSTIGFSPWTAAAGGAALAAGRYGGAKAFEAAKQKMLTSPTYQRAIMQGETPFMHNVLTGPVAVSGAVSAAETQKARRKK